MNKYLFSSAILIALTITLASCNEANEAPRVELPLVVNAQGVKTTANDLGYQVELSEARMAIRAMRFTIAGELHSQLFWDTISEAIIPSAHAHPGHYAGGEVTGELPGAYVIDWLQDDGRELGAATLLAGDYTGANFVFDRGSEDLLEPDDPMIGHTALLAGTARRNGVSTPFTITIDSPEDRVLVGAPMTRADRPLSEGFKAPLDEASTGTLRFSLEIQDPLEQTTLFDGIDFEELDADSNGMIRIEADSSGTTEDAYNLLRRTFQLHSHYMIYHQE